MAKKRIKLERREERREFSIIFDDLWKDCLAHIGGSGALLYCYLKYLAGRDVAHPCSSEWEQEVCLPLGMTLKESHEAWARLQEIGLILLEKNSYFLCDPRRSAGVTKDSASDKLLVEVEALFGRPLSMTEIHQLGDLGNSYDEALMRSAVHVAVGARALSLAYIRQVLLNWKAKGIVSAAQAEADLVGFQEKKARRSARVVSNKNERSVTPPSTPAVRGKYDEAEIIMRRIRKASSDEVRHGN